MTSCLTYYLLGWIDIGRKARQQKRINIFFGFFPLSNGDVKHATHRWMIYHCLEVEMDAQHAQLNKQHTAALVHEFSRLLKATTRIFSKAPAKESTVKNSWLFRYRLFRFCFFLVLCLFLFLVVSLDVLQNKNTNLRHNRKMSSKRTTRKRKRKRRTP